MPTTAQDRVRRGPLGALLILLSLFLGSATATAAAADFRGAAARLGSTRPGTAPALLPSGTRYAVDDERLSSGVGPYVPPSVPGIVTERLWVGPKATARFDARSAVPRPTTASYRARAPPAF